MGKMSTSWAWGSSKPLIEGFAPYFTPQQAFVNSGIRIVWENPTATSHTITHDGCKVGGACAFDSDAIRPHETFEIMGLPPSEHILIIAHATPSCGVCSKLASLSRPYPSDFQGVIEKVNGCGILWVRTIFPQNPLTLKNGKLL